MGDEVVNPGDPEVDASTDDTVTEPSAGLTPGLRPGVAVKINALRARLTWFNREAIRIAEEAMSLAADLNVCLGQSADVSVDELMVSVRTYNRLRRMNIKTLGDLVGVTEKQLLGDNFGKKSLRELSEALAEFGYEIKPGALRSYTTTGIIGVKEWKP